MDESGITQNRRSRRSQLFMTARLEVSGRAIDVKLRNLSSEGARVEGEAIPVEGTELLFRKGDLAIPARIVWVHGTQAGIGFKEALNTDEVLNHVAAPRARIQREFRRPGLMPRDLTRTERLLAEGWIVNPPPPPIAD